MNEKPVIRPYVPADREAIIRLLRLNTPTYFAPEEEPDLLFYLDAEAEHYFVVEINGALAGSGGFNFADNGKNGRISWDIVHPDHQGKGIGSLLTRFRIDTNCAQCRTCNWYRCARRSWRSGSTKSSAFG